MFENKIIFFYNILFKRIESNYINFIIDYVLLCLRSLPFNLLLLLKIFLIKSILLLT